MTLARLKHLLPLALLIAGLVGLWAFGLQQDLSWASLSRHQADLLAIVAARPIEVGAAYVAIYAATVAFSVPEGALVTIAGGLLFGTALGGTLAIIAASAGAVILFLSARYAFADLVAARAAPFMARIRPGIERDGFLYLLALRLVPLFPFWLLNLVAAACGMRLLPFTAATMIGIVPGTFVYASLGAGLAGVLASGGTPDFAMIFAPRILLPLLGLAALTLLPVGWRALKSWMPKGAMPEFDLAVIGAGSAGLSVTAVAAQLGLKVALIERDRMGGDCLNTGCVPSKALLAAAHAAQSARVAGRFGVRLPEPVIDWDAVRAHVTGTITAIAPMDSELRFRALGAEVLRGEARFLDPDTLGVDGRRLTARRIVIAAGSRAVVPPIPGLDAVPSLTNETLFTLAHKPTHLLVVGGGPVGLEMAAAHAGLGCHVTLVEAGRIAAREDPELADGLRRAILAQGVTLIEGMSVAGVESGPTLLLADGNRIIGSHLLVAAGRQPNLERLALEAGNVRASLAGIATDRGLRKLTNRRVFAIGDIADPVGIGPRAFTHVGSYHASIVIRRALFRLPAKLDYAAMPRVIYTTPELAQVGLTEAEARAAGHNVTLLRAPMAENDRMVAEGDSAGLVKLVISGNRVLGAGILAPHAGEMIGQWTLAIAQRVKLTALAGLIVPYPTRAEAAKRCLTGLFAPRLFAARTKSLVKLLIRLP